MDNVAEQVKLHLKTLTPEETWQQISRELLKANTPFATYLDVFTQIFPEWRSHPDTGPLWQPTDAFIRTTHLAKMMKELNIDSFKKLHQWSAAHPDAFWQQTIEKLQIIFKTKPQKVCDLKHGIENPNWLSHAKINIADSCFKANSDKIAIITQRKNTPLTKITYGELHLLANRIANSLLRQGFQQGDAIAIDMPMNHYAVAIYLGVLQIGGIIVSIADSFSSEEIATRLRIANAKAIFTQDFILREDKKLPLYEKVIGANAPRAIVLACENNSSCELRKCDMTWDQFLENNTEFNSVACNPMDTCNILFSSGTTGDPKAIPWNHTTAIKAASDAYYHQNIQTDDILAWPTNLGWMMGPWLIFATFINNATMALYDDVPRGKAFGQFVEDAKVSMLGVVPTLVSAWRQTHCMEGLNWDAIRLFSSTGECSNPEDMFYLSWLAGYKPIIEYCGGTEIGGAYITSTLIEKNYPSTFTTPTMGLDFVLLDESGKENDAGEVALIPPSIGLSTTLLNADHHQTYFANMPMLRGKTLRRHGDQLQRFASGNYCILGRVDDTMNLGGIKVSSAEIERVLAGMDDIIETAAIAVTLTQPGPALLVIYAATAKSLDKLFIQKQMQKRINEHLNPLFKIHDVVFVKELPKTASNKIMRRVLRKMS